MQILKLALTVSSLCFCVVSWAQDTTQSTPQVGKHVATNNLDLAGMLLSLCAVLAVIVIAASLLKKFQLGPSANKDLKIVTSMHLSAKERLVVVEVDNKQLLLGVTAHNISLIKELENPIESAQAFGAELNGSLSKLLKKQ